MDRIEYRQLFPWTHLFRAFWIAVDLRKILLGSLAVLALAAGDAGIRRLPFGTDAPPRWSDWPWRQESGFAVSPARFGMTDGPPIVIDNDTIRFQIDAAVDSVQNSPGRFAFAILGNWPLVYQPAERVYGPAASLFHSGNSWSAVALAWTRILWALVVFAIFGGAISRMSALQFAVEERIGIRAALRFALSRFLAYMASPLLPFVGIGALWVLMLLGGLAGRIPASGAPLVGMLWILAMVFGFCAALILLGAAAGWPLMYATISAEGSDGFDGFSRAYSYIFSKPWHAAWNALVALTFGSALLFFVWTVLLLLTHLSAWGVASGMGADTVSQLLRGGPRLLDLPGATISGENLSASMGAMAASWWLNALATLFFGFAHSYFWTSATIIYFLLRKTDDATEFDEVYRTDADDEDELLPLVGVAASDQPIVERPVRPPSSGAPATPPKPDVVDTSETE